MTPLPAFIQGLNQKVNMETGSCSCHHQHGDFVLTPILSAGMTQAEAEEAILHAHVLCHDNVHSGGSVLLPHHQRNH